MAKLNANLKITLIIITIILAIGAIATPIILLTNANSDTNSENREPNAPDDTSQSATPPPLIDPANPPETISEEELIIYRNNQRHSDAARLQSAITQFQVNNNGKLPGQSNQQDGDHINGQGEYIYQPSPNHALPSSDEGIAAKLVTRYLNNNSPINTFVAPDNWTYGLTLTHYDYYADLPNKNTNRMFYVVYQANCNATSILSRSSKPHDFSILYLLEDATIYCLDNQ